MPTRAIPEARLEVRGEARKARGEKGANERRLSPVPLSFKKERSVFLGTMRSDYG